MEWLSGRAAAEETDAAPFEERSGFEVPSELEKDWSALVTWERYVEKLRGSRME